MKAPDKLFTAVSVMSTRDSHAPTLTYHISLLVVVAKPILFCSITRIV